MRFPRIKRCVEIAGEAEEKEVEADAEVGTEEETEATKRAEEKNDSDTEVTVPGGVEAQRLSKRNERGVKRKQFPW